MTLVSYPVADVRARAETPEKGSAPFDPVCTQYDCHLSSRRLLERGSTCVASPKCEDCRIREARSPPGRGYIAALALAFASGLLTSGGGWVRSTALFPAVLW